MLITTRESYGCETLLTPTLKELNKKRGCGFEKVIVSMNGSILLGLWCAVDSFSIDSIFGY